MEEDEFDTARWERRDKNTKQVLETGVHLVQNDDAVEGRLLEGAGFDRDEWGGPAVRFFMKPNGRARLAATTEKYKNHRMAIILDGVAISAPNIETPITEGSGIIRGSFTKEEVDELITVLSSGALPAKPQLASEDTFEATLGQEQIRRGMISLAAAMALVFGFMVVYYFGAGAIADFGLLCNLILILGVMSLFEATLTLPGIFGLVLSLGMSVDANVLIAERIREEKRRGLPVAEATMAGYHNAFWAITDSNITTMLTSAILYSVGTGPIKGFALTLGLGIAISMFSALFITKALFEFFLSRGTMTKVRMLELGLGTPNFPFLARRKPYVILGVVLLNLGYLAFVLRGDEKYGIDFNGGTALQVRFMTPLTKAEVEGRLAKIEKPGPDQRTVKPYVDADVFRLGAELDKRGAGKHFKVLVSTDRSREPRRLASLGGAAADVRPAADQAGGSTAAAEPAATEKTSAAETQEAFIEDMRRTFATELAPPAFSPLRITTDPAAEGKGRVSLDVRVAEEKRIDPEEARRALAEVGFIGAEVTVIDGGRAVSVTAGPLDFEPRSLERSTQKLKGVFEEKFATALSNPFPYKASIGPSVAETLKYRALLAIVLAVAGLIVYVAFRFEVKMGIAATLCLVHDVLVTLGFMMLLDATSRWTGIDAKQSLNLIAAYLTIVGYQINDTIVTFDRVRENLAKWTPGHGTPDHPEWKTYEDVLNASINQTLGRTILITSLVFVTLLVLAFAGVKSLQGFTLAMIVGTIAGTYSTIFIATPILLVEPKKLLTFVAAEVGFFVVAGVAGGYVQL
jgi:SecD/SecF fusion protein